jgi:signal transduction histidine kinase
MRYEGLSVTTNPAAESVRFESLTMKSGLSSNIVSCLVEGKDGYVYAGTGRGIDRLDPASKHVEAVGPASVLSGAWVRSCTTDQRGRIWASTVYGVARIDAFVADPTTTAAPLYITRVETNGVPLGLPSLGLRDVGDVELPPGTNSLHIRFSSPALRPERRVIYQYRVLGLDDDWRVADESQAVEYGRVPVGRYRFEVRAVEPGSPDPLAQATVSVTALAPIWARPWVLAVLVATLALLGLAAHRLRVRQVLALEHVRQQVALDLHDDIGSGLAEIAILSEVAKREPGKASAVIDDVGRLSRRLRESMADIVWAVDPRFDTLEDVAARIRETAFNLLESQRIALTTAVPEAAVLRGVRLDARSRRHLLLLAKELVTNVAKHSGATAVEITLAVERDRVLLVVNDNGHGFDTRSRRGNGHGLRSLGHRTASMGGTMDLQSSPAGTSVRVSCPLKRTGTASPKNGRVSGPDREAEPPDGRA